ncbi:arginase family protein [Amaricoccus sp.]|uniref:arginase family protein n=1 Tax=Amaricoccus sp. TaxID=1872485 RepID=UPI001B63DC29|nr:arginase family protein [Amaricoccus sp.]MBP7241145.1 arginase family protein [Amaricoccus sp.]
MTSTTLRLNMPQWQGGDEPAYRFGAELLRWLAPPHDGPEETVAVPEPDGRTPPVEHGIKWRAALLSQARAARAAIERHEPDRIVTLGGDCLVDLAPIAYLSRKYGEKLGALWLDAHPDVMSAAEFSHAHAHVLAMLLGRGDEAFTAEVLEKLDARCVMIAGMRGWNEAEDPILKELGLRHIPPAAIADSSRPVLDWIESEGITHVAVHFDLDVLDPAHFSPLLFNRPGAPEGAFDGVEQGRMRLEQAVRLLKDVGAAADMVGLAITEHLPWDMLRLKTSLAELPIMRS